jgi:hypothetical protein
MTDTGGSRARRFMLAAGRIPAASRHRSRSAPPLPGKARRSVRAESRNWSGLAALVSSFTAIAALVFTAQSLQATREQIAIAAQDEVTGRLTAAIGQLGSSNSNVRVGAIFALGSIAHDAAYQQPAIIDLLSDFIRGQTGGSGRPGTGQCDPESDPAPDVMAALTVLGQRDPAQDGQATIALEGACLDNAILEGLNLSGADLDGACFVDAALVRTDLANANLADADLTGAQLQETRLAGARLEFANFSSASLEHADLDNVAPGYATFTRADLSGASVAPYPDVKAFLKYSLATPAGTSCTE